MKTIKLVIDKLPPSKNLLYYGSSYKYAYEKYVLSFSNNREIIKHIRALASSREYIPFYVEIKFFIPKSKYKKFEPQNYIEVLFDVIFGDKRDNRVKKFCVDTIPSDGTQIQISISTL